MKKVTFLSAVIASMSATTAMSELKLPAGAVPAKPALEVPNLPTKSANKPVITEEMKSLKVAYGTYLNKLEKLLTDSGTVEGDVSAVDWLSEQEAEQNFEMSAYELGFLNDANATIVQPRTAHFIKGAITYRVNAKIKDIETISLDFDAPLTWDQLDRLAKTQSNVVVPLEEVKVTSPSFSIQTGGNMLDARVGDESGINILQDNDHSLVDNIDVSFVFRNTVDKARYDMIFNATVLDDDSDPIKENRLNECSTIVEVGGERFIAVKGLHIAQRNLSPLR